MRMSSQVVRMRSVQRITLLLELRMRIIDLEEFFENSREIGQETEFIPARPDHQNVKKIRKFFLVKIIVSKYTLTFSYLITF